MKDFQEALAYLWGLKRLGTRPGTETTAALLHELGDPQRTFRAIHITGSKGKGSVAALCASALQASGHRTGLYTSPHLLSFRERARVDGEVASPEELVGGLARVRRAIRALERKEGLDRDPTFFEVATVWAFDLFRRRGVDVAAVEVGLGGRLDATNVLRAPVTVVTTLELEHTELLGPTLEDIAREKAGILHPGAWGVTGVEDGPGLSVLRREAFRQGVPLWRLGEEVRVDGARLEPEERGQRLDVSTPHGRHRDLYLPLLGTFQAKNAALAVAALDLFGRATGKGVGEAALREGFAAARWPGRLEKLGATPLTYVDAAHTPLSAREVVRSLQALHPGRDPETNVLLFSCLADKHTEEMLRELATYFRHAVVFPLATERGLDLKALALAARGKFGSLLVAASPEEGLRLARAAVEQDGLLLATGGIYLAGQVLSALRGVPPEGPDLTDPVGRILNDSVATSRVAPRPGRPLAPPAAPRARRKGARRP